MSKNTCVWTVKNKHISTECNIALVNENKLTPKPKSSCPFCGGEIELKYHPSYGY